MKKEEVVEKFRKTEMYYMISKHFDGETVELMIDELGDALSDD